MKKLILVLVFLVGLALMLTCQQFLSRNWGGTTTITLEPGERLLEATWKDNNLWFLVEPMDDDYIPKTKVFKSSMYGLLEGKVIFIERRK